MPLTCFDFLDFVVLGLDVKILLLLDEAVVSAPFLASILLVVSGLGCLSLEFEVELVAPFGNMVRAWRLTELSPLLRLLERTPDEVWLVPETVEVPEDEPTVCTLIY